MKFSYRFAFLLLLALSMGLMSAELAADKFSYLVVAESAVDQLALDVESSDDVDADNFSSVTFSIVKVCCLALGISQHTHFKIQALLPDTRAPPLI